MEDPFILSATLKHYGPELSTLGGEQIEVEMYVVYEDGSAEVISVYGKNLPQFIRNLRQLDMRNANKVAP